MAIGSRPQGAEAPIISFLPAPFGRNPAPYQACEARAAQHSAPFVAAPMALATGRQVQATARYLPDFDETVLFRLAGVYESDGVERLISRRAERRRALRPR
jgi:hypothetical protein